MPGPPSCRKAPARVLLLGAAFDTGNLGVNALASGTIASVLHTWPGARIDLLDYGKEPLTYQAWDGKRDVPVKLINLRFSKMAYLRNNIARLLLTVLGLKAVPSASLRRKCLARNPYLKQILEADLVLAISGGDSFSDIYRLPRLFYGAFPQILVLWLNKPLVLLPQTYGPFKTGVARIIARYILRRARRVFSRDEAGQQVVAELLNEPPGRVQFAYDMAFALEAIPPREAGALALIENLRKSQVLAGLNVSGLLYGGGYGKKDFFKGALDYRELVDEVIRFLIEDQKADVILVPHVFSAVANVNDEIGDNTACQDVFKRLAGKYPGRLHLAEGTFNQHEIKYVIGQCDFFLGARMHACIAAISQCVPAISFAYSRKFLGVMKSVGAEDLVVDFMKSNLEEAMSAVKKNFYARRQIRERLQKTIPLVKDRVLNLLAGLEHEANS
jgi:colanic acid/amylovoran biosynthesis protein